MKMFKPTIIATLVFMAAMTSTSIARAEDATTAKDPHAGQKSSEKDDEKLTDPVDKLAAKMKLTPEQKTKLAPLLKEETEKLAKLKANTELSKEKKSEAKKKITETFQAKVKESRVLTDAQYKAWTTPTTKKAEAGDKTASPPAKKAE